MEKAKFIESNTNLNSRVRDYISLLKPRVMSLVVLSGLTGLVLAPGDIHPFIAFVAILAIAVGAGASGAINMWYDRDIDSIMLRTRNRPIVTGKIEPNEALYFGIGMAFFAILVMFVCVNIVAATLLLITILFYVFIYTIWLKRISPQNIVIGGAAGAFPPMIGWAAVTNNISIESISLFLLIFLWTPPHFWALALYKSDDYKKCNIPMMPVVAGSWHTKKLIILYTILTVISSFIPFYLNMVGYFYLLVSIILGIVFLHHTLMLLLDVDNILAQKLFRFSILYLFSLLLAMIISKIL
jgi:protoheme IX farnesyltransferase